MVSYSQGSVMYGLTLVPSEDRTVNKLPTPEEIAAECAAIRAAWTPSERRRATTVRPLPWMIPQGVRSHRRVTREDGE